MKRPRRVRFLANELNSGASSPVQIPIPKNKRARKSSLSRIPRKRARRTSPINSPSPKTTDFENDDDLDDLNVMKQLPMEMKCEIFEYLSNKDQKEARLISKEWDAIFQKQKDFKFKPKLSDDTSKMLENTKLEFEEITVTTLKDRDFPSKASNVFKDGSRIHTLIFEKPNVPLQNIIALAKALPNIRKLRLELTGHNRHYRRYANFLNHDMCSLTSVCQNLTMVEVILGRARFNWEINGGVFLQCSKLQKVIISTRSGGRIRLIEFVDSATRTVSLAIRPLVN